MSATAEDLTSLLSETGSIETGRLADRLHLTKTELAQPMMLVGYRVNCAGVVDLTDPAMQQGLDVDHDILGRLPKDASSWD